MQARPTLAHSRKAEIRQEALTRAVTGQSYSNYPAIVAGFMAKGIPEDQIKPRENVFTYEAWRALGRYASEVSEESKGQGHWGGKSRVLFSALDGHRVPHLPDGGVRMTQELFL